MWFTRQVFRCFKCVERSAERLTGAVGPLFIGIAIVLISTGIFTFFDVIAPTLRFRLLSTPICALIALNTVAHYYWAITIPPGFADEDFSITGQRRHPHQSRWSRWLTAPTYSRSRGSDYIPGLELETGRVGKCMKCGSVKPERTHHCRICKRCVLKYDHHCPVSPLLWWINQCVGINNERHFILFMVYLIVCCICFLVLGANTAWEVFGMTFYWPHQTPQIVFMLIYIIAFALGLAVGAMCSWHLYLISKGQTSVESHDAGTYRKVAASRGETFVNAYSLGVRRNFALFFNLTPTGHPWWVLLTPLKTVPYTNGFAWIKRPGYESGHGGIREEEELTDQDDED
ncbi:zf-DHHC-domain-containing protein [Serendipita vermifera]|nr:zf-DHHC-domain-containing protein [Serendipita vermifera]